jgi:hypothetical protein
MYHIVRASMTNFLAPEEVPFQRQDSPPVRDLSSCIHMRACEISVQGSFAQPVVVHQRRYQRTSCPALTQLLHLRRSQRMLAAKPYTVALRMGDALQLSCLAQSSLKRSNSTKDLEEYAAGGGTCLEGLVEDLQLHLCARQLLGSRTC